MSLEYFFLDQGRAVKSAFVGGIIRDPAKTASVKFQQPVIRQNWECASRLTAVEFSVRFWTASCRVARRTEKQSEKSTAPGNHANKRQVFFIGCPFPSDKQSRLHSLRFFYGSISRGQNDAAHGPPGFDPIMGFSRLAQGSVSRAG
jgi:hypothetical protein